MTVAPTSAIPFGPRVPHATTAARTRAAALLRITRGMIVEDLPPVGATLEHQGKWAARRRVSAPEEDESGRQKCVAIAERPSGHLFESQTVPACPRCESGCVARPDEIPTLMDMAGFHERGRAVRGVVAHEAVEVAAIPIIRGSVELAGELRGQCRVCAPGV